MIVPCGSPPSRWALTTVAGPKFAAVRAKETVGGGSPVTGPSLMENAEAVEAEP